MSKTLDKSALIEQLAGEILADLASRMKKHKASFESLPIEDQEVVLVQAMNGAFVSLGARLGFTLETMKLATEEIYNIIVERTKETNGESKLD